jgi:hypothetical protein
MYIEHEKGARLVSGDPRTIAMSPTLGPEVLAIPRFLCVRAVHILRHSVRCHEHLKADSCDPVAALNDPEARRQDTGY